MNKTKKLLLEALLLCIEDCKETLESTGINKERESLVEQICRLSDAWVNVQEKG